MATSSGKSNALAQAFRDRFERAPRLFSAPGRLNLLGEHTDENQGLVLAVALAERTRVAAAPRADRTVRAYSATLRKDRSFSLDAAWTRRGKWLDYVEGVARALAARGVPTGGADLYIGSDVPLGAGLSSSAALTLALTLAFAALAGVELAPRDVVAVAQAAEAEYVGSRPGVMDHLVAALGRAGHATLVDCRSLETSDVPIPELSAKLLVCDTRVRPDPLSAAVRMRAEECRQALDLLRSRGFELASLRELAVPRLDEATRGLPPLLARRVRHVVRENARTSAAVDALRRGHLAGLGRLMSGSHASLRDDYEISYAELDHVVDTALRLEGVLGARMLGGGLGGAVVLLVRSERLASVAPLLRESYRQRFGAEPELYVTGPGDGMRADFEASA